jgi:phospholipase A1
MVVAATTHAADDLAGCADIENAKQRLACYDELAKPSTAAARGASASYLTRAWKLAPEDAAPRRLADYVAYRPNYVILHWTDSPNFRPRSPSTGPSALPDLDHTEIKLQGSLKTELLSREAFAHAGISGALGHVGIDNARLWFAYTQKMAWQAFNHGEERPIRDTNYEPELILTLGTANKADGLKLINLGLSHESNGIDPREHRGWSRMYAQAGWDWGRLSVLPRLWHVVPQSDDDNPNIRRFMGSGDVVTRYESAGGYVASMLLRRNFGSDKSFAELDWATPVQRRLGNLKFFVQLTSGYGEMLIDYNHRQTTLGAGVSFGDW